VLRIPLRKSDHSVLIFDCKVHTSKTNHTFKRALSKCITSNEDKTTALGQFFSSVFTNETQTTYDTQDINFTYAGSTNISFTEHTILTKLENLKLTKSFGPDTLHPRIL